MIILLVAQAIYGADFQVNQLGDAGDGTCDATCTLRDAVTAVNGAGDDSISFSYLVFNAGATITLTGGEMVLTNNGSVSINGIGADKITINGNSTGRIFTIGADAVVNISGLTFTGGNGAGATTTGRAGAILNVGGMFTVTDSVFTNNTAVNGGAMNTTSPGVTNIINCDINNNTANGSSGGGLQNFSGATTNISYSTFRNNRMMGGIAATGGAIQSNGNIRITNSTFTGNMTTNDGGAISFNGSSMVMTNTTITGNTATDQTGGLHKTTTANTAIIRNNIIAGNTAANNADSQGLFNSQGFNLIQNPGTTTGLTPQDITGMAALISPLGNYGGLTYTHALLSGSPALNAADNCVIDLSCAAGNPPFAVSIDQRGAARTMVDIGSFESSTTFVAELDEGAVGVAYNEEITPNRGTFTYTLIGSLPPGLSLNVAGTEKGGDGAAGRVSIAGTPTTLGSFDFGIMISNGTNSTTVNYRIVIAPTRLTGRLLDDGGNPVSGVFVTLSDGMGGVQRAQTSVDGTYTFSNVTAGTTYTVSFRSRRYAFRSEGILIVAGTNRVDPIIPN